MEAYIEPVNEYVTEAWTNALNQAGVTVYTHRPKNAAKLIFLYQDYDTYDFETRDSQAQWVYSYIYRKALTRKNYLGNTILHYRVKRPDSILHTAWPDSFNFELDFPEFLDDALDESWDLKQELEAGGKTWILKPALGERAHGIKIFETQDDLQAIFDETMGNNGSDADDGDEEENAEMRQYVVQEYVTNPLLIDKRKFHLRVYCLCIGKMQVYVNTRMLALFSGTDYDPANYKNLRGHLTNTCFQGEEAKVSLLEDELPQESSEIVDKICSCVHDLFEAAQGDPINFQPLPNAIEFYGLDFIVTTDLDIKLLEVNAYPDFKQTGDRLSFVVSNMFTETINLLLKNGEGVKDLRRVL